MNSIWEKSEKPNFETLKGEVKTDVLIIGGGLAGILCGWKLKNAGVNCIIAEANEICSGTTGNTTGKITVQHGCIYAKMLKRFGRDATKLYIKAHNEALEEYRGLSGKINCDFKEQNSFVYAINDRTKIEKEVAALNSMGINARFCESLPLPFSVAGAVKFENQAQFNPLKFAYSLAPDLNIFENTRILELMPDGAVTQNGKIKAEKIIVTTHFPFLNKHGAYFIKMYQHRSYVLALSGAENVNGMYVDESDRGLSFRNCGELLLLGGGGHRTGKKGGARGELYSFARVHYPKAKAVAHWAAQDCKTLDDIPYIGQYSKSTPNLYVATGFNKWGMTSSMVSATVLCDLINGKPNEYAEIFSPSRSVIRPQLAVNVGEAAIGMFKPTVPRCPHLGCALKFNPLEHSWDCSCHGSRFNADGKLLDGPANGDKKLK